MRTNKELQRENDKLRLRLKKCMVWRREVRRLNKAIEFYALKLKCHKDYEQNELQRLKKTTDFRPPWAPDIEGSVFDDIALMTDCDLIDCDLIASAAARGGPLGNTTDGINLIATKEIKPADNGSETTTDAPQSEEQDRPIWQQYPQLKE